MYYLKELMNAVTWLHPLHNCITLADGEPSIAYRLKIYASYQKRLTSPLRKSSSKWHLAAE